uniref:Uncharacterized protein n=1 Tax=Anguilla anguilla TaxID=7936 RepID=A0A0E9P6R7_ANGAN
MTNNGNENSSCCMPQKLRILFSVVDCLRSMLLFVFRAPHLACH